MMMNKRQRDSIARKIDQITVKIGKKRDEMRALVGDLEGLVASVEEAAEGMDWTIHHLKEARQNLDGAVDSASQLV